MQNIFFITYDNIINNIEYDKNSLHYKLYFGEYNYYNNLFLYITLTLNIFYLPFIYYCQNFIKSFKCNKKFLLTHNLFMSLFSFYLFFKLYNQNFLEIPNIEFQKKIINNDNIYYYMYIYCITKPIEFIDTFFLINKKRKLIFLHYYHHFITTFYCLISIKYYTNFGHYFCFINLFVHGIMYMYYFLVILNNKISILLKKYSYFLTIIQILQMIKGIQISIYSYSINYNDEINFKITIFSILMYISYFYLFVKLFINRYVKKYN